MKFVPWGLSVILATLMFFVLSSKNKEIDTLNLHKTTVAWDFNKSSHISATIKSDTAPIAVSTENLKLINRFFEMEVYPLAKAAFSE